MSPRGVYERKLRASEERFWSKVDVRGLGECWPWTGARNTKGYGTFWVGEHKWSTASRFAWERTNGLIPAGMQVCHRCDNPPCVNEAHLFLGSAADNTADMVAKGRGTARLSMGDVREIRRMYPHVRQVALAELYGVAQATISNIVREKTWRTG
jgi:hypothetical protein